MLTILYAAAAALMVFGIFKILGLTSVQITQDMMEMLRPSDQIRTVASDVQAKRKRKGLYSTLQRIRNTMDTMGKGKLFPLAVTGVVGLGALGVLISMLMGNVWLMPALMIGLGSIPILYMINAVDYYEKAVRDELETALSIITNAYIRTDNIVVAVEENLKAIKPPLKKIFEQFVREGRVIPSQKEIILRMRDRLDDAVFYEWCTTLLQCQDDRTLKENLHPVVGKLTDIRLVNTQIEAIVVSAKIEYYALVAFVIVSIPIMEAMTPGSLEMLMTTPIGNFLLGIVADVVLFTYFRMRAVTRAVDYDTK